MLFRYVGHWLGLFLAYIYNHYHTIGFVHVEIDKGILRGGNVTTWRGKSYLSFKGIPYAKPPINELRFKDPEEETAWAGVREAVFHGEVCPQLSLRLDLPVGQEDCLFLNVYTPSLKNVRMPVMFWIHGGMFALGSGNDHYYAPDYFMESGVVLVTINYRLGALGFLSTEDDGAPGNAGLKDQVAALRWVRRNIASFGGDPDNVTIFGSSSGAACVHLHMLSPMSAGLFSKAILQSGSALNPWAVSVNNAKLTVILAEAMGGKDIAGDTTRALEFLKIAPYEDFAKIQATLKTPEKERLHLYFLFAPTVEKGVKSDEVFLPDLPLEIMKSGNFTKVPYIIGYTSDESYFFMNEIVRPEIRRAAIEDTERYIPRDIEDNQVRRELARSIREFYFDDKPIGNENISNFAELHMDTTFVAGITRSMKLHNEVTNTPIYFFIFSYDDTLNIMKFVFNINCAGAVHGDELGYLFQHRFLYHRAPVSGSSNQYVVDTMIRLWTNFAKYGNPTPAGDPLNWKAVTIDKFNYLNISGRTEEADVNPLLERINFWAKAYEKSSTLRADVCWDKACSQYEK